MLDAARCGTDAATKNRMTRVVRYRFSAWRPRPRHDSRSARRARLPIVQSGATPVAGGCAPVANDAGSIVVGVPRGRCSPMIMEDLCWQGAQIFHDHGGEPLGIGEG